jgi:hypothetical protein
MGPREEANSGKRIDLVPGPEVEEKARGMGLCTPPGWHDARVNEALARQGSRR